MSMQIFSSTQTDAINAQQNCLHCKLSDEQNDNSIATVVGAKTKPITEFVVYSLPAFGGLPTPTPVICAVSTSKPNYLTYAQLICLQTNHQSVLT